MIRAPFWGLEGGGVRGGFNMAKMEVTVIIEAMPLLLLCSNLRPYCIDFPKIASYFRMIKHYIQLNGRNNGNKMGPCDWKQNEDMTN